MSEIRWWVVDLSDAPQKRGLWNLDLGHLYLDLFQNTFCCSNINSKTNSRFQSHQAPQDHAISERPCFSSIRFSMRTFFPFHHPEPPTRYHTYNSSPLPRPRVPRRKTHLGTRSPIFSPASNRAALHRRLSRLPSSRAITQTAKAKSNAMLSQNNTFPRMNPRPSKMQKRSQLSILITLPYLRIYPLRSAPPRRAKPRQYVPQHRLVRPLFHP